MPPSYRSRESAQDLQGATNRPGHARHSVLGDDLSGQHDPQWKVLLAKVIADAIARRLLTRRYHVLQQVDAQNLYREHTDWMTRILPRVQRVVLAGRSLAMGAARASAAAEA